MRSCIVSGSFDPVTLGHIDIIKRASDIFDKVYAVMLINPEKTYMFTKEQRMEMLNAAVEGIATADFYGGYTVDYCLKNNIRYIVRGIRSVESYAYEHRIDTINRSINQDISTVYLPSRPELSYISSTLIREKIIKGEDISPFVPKEIIALIGEYYGKH